MAQGQLLYEDLIRYEGKVLTPVSEIIRCQLRLISPRITKISWWKPMIRKGHLGPRKWVG